MLYGLINLNWFDVTTVGLTLSAIVLVQILNALWSTVDDRRTTSDNNGPVISVKTSDLKSLISHDSSTATATNDKIQKTQSESNENGLLNSTASPILKAPTPPPPPPPSRPPLLSTLSLSSPSPPPPPAVSSPPSNARSVSYPLSGSGVGIHHPLHYTTSLPDHLSDEYHEDEDTISVENLFPCDQTEIYATKKISFIIDEIIQTEENYVNNLKKGLTNYGDLQKFDLLPEALRGEEKQKCLLGNITEILELHEREVLPMMLKNQRDLKSMFDEMAHYIDKDQFYCYVTFTMHKKASLELRKENREFFQSYQTIINDRLGIDSFLVQPIQRLTRYPLLLQQLIAEFYKNAINCKPVLASLCKLETRMRRLLEVVNQAEEILSIEELVPELDVNLLGSFRRATEFDAYNHRARKKFRAKVFLFDQCLVCTEVRKRRLVYKSHFSWQTIELKLNNSKSITLLTRASTTTKPEECSAAASSSSSSSLKEEYEFSSPEAISINQWLRCARRIVENSRLRESQRGKLVLPTDLILGVVFALWWLWLCL